MALSLKQPCVSRGYSDTLSNGYPGLSCSSKNSASDGKARDLIPAATVFVSLEHELVTMSTVHSTRK